MSVDNTVDEFGRRVRSEPLVADTRSAQEKADVLYRMHDDHEQHMERSRSVLSPTHLNYVFAKTLESRGVLAAHRAVRRARRTRRVLKALRLVRGD